MHELELKKRLAEEEGTVDELRREVDTTDSKLSGKNRHELPTLSMDRHDGYKSGKNFRTTARGSRYTDHQIIAHLVALGEKQDGAKVSKNGEKVGRMMKKVQSAMEGVMRSRREEGKKTRNTNDDEWATEVIKQFWEKREKRFGDGPPAARLEARQGVSRSVTGHCYACGTVTHRKMGWTSSRSCRRRRLTWVLSARTTW
jgi:hypothetical protein